MFRSRPQGKAPTNGSGRRALRPATAPRGCGCVTAGVTSRAPLPSRLARQLPGLPVRRVATAPAAVLLELDPVRGIPLGLLRLVVAPLALRAGERDRDSYSGCHCSFLSWKWDEKGCSSSGGRARTCDTRKIVPRLLPTELLARARK